MRTEYLKLVIFGYPGTSSTHHTINPWYPRSIREAIEMFKHDAVPQDIGFYISDIWRPLYYGPKDLLYPQSTTHPQTEGSPTSQVNHPPPVLVNN